MLIFHRKLKLWLQPGGHFESQDGGLADAATREVAEETGVSELQVLTPLVDIDVHPIPAFGAEAPHLHHDLRVLFQASRVDLAPSAEVLGARWVDLSELAAPARAESLLTDESVRRVARLLLSGPSLPAH